jgi:signal transduction histidine kinase
MASDRQPGDVALFAAAVGLGGLTLAYLWHDHGPVLDGLDVAFGMVACLALWWRRGYPMAVFALAFGAAAFSPLALFAGLVAISTAASRVRGRALIAVVVMSAVASVVFPLVNPEAGEMLKVGFPAFLVTIIALGWGLYLRTRRDLVASLRERTARLEADQQRSTELAREAERRRIAREMHDVLAHRLSLLSVHAGALEFRPDAPAADVARAATVIRTSAAAALDDLRQVITVLREDDDGAAPPQPGFDEIGDLVEESRLAGMTITLRIDLPEGLPAAAGRTAFRVIQEGLTNARKHAPGVSVEVAVTADGPVGLVAEVISHAPANGISENGLSTAGMTGAGMSKAGMSGAGMSKAGMSGAGMSGAGMSGAGLPGAGAGLIGLAERLELVGGRLEHGPTLSGGFLLRATIPIRS